MNIQDKVYHYSYTNRDNTGIISAENKFTSKVHEVLGVNDRYIVINDRAFTTIEIKNDDNYGTKLDKDYCHFYLGDTCFGNGVNFTLYSTKPVEPKKIKAMIEKHIKKKLQFLGNLDLSVILESEAAK